MLRQTNSWNVIYKIRNIFSFRMFIMLLFFINCLVFIVKYSCAVFTQGILPSVPIKNVIIMMNKLTDSNQTCCFTKSQTKQFPFRGARQCYVWMCLHFIQSQPETSVYLHYQTDSLGTRISLTCTILMEITLANT